MDRDCCVTIKLIQRESSGRKYCETYVRSEENSDRDQDPHSQFEIGNGENTAFDKALQYDGTCSYFYSPDLIADRKKFKYKKGRRSARYVLQKRVIIYSCRFDYPTSNNMLAGCDLFSCCETSLNMI